jgi:fused signal recognition particle receptor
MASLFDRIKAGLSKTAQQIRERLSDVTGSAPATPAPVASTTTATAPTTPAGKPAPRVTEADTLEAVEDALIMADVGLPATMHILSSVKGDRSGSVRDRVKRVMLGILSNTRPPVDVTSKPHIVLVVGVNGTGKTTTVGKLARWHQSQGRRVLVCAADTFRAAAVEQVGVWAARAGVDIVRAQMGADPAAVTFDAVSAAKARGHDVVLVDTAGRLHTRTNLMAELDKIRRVVGREVPDAPQEVLLVLDATVGQNGLAQAREFMAASGANGIVLTKLDGTAKGGVAVAIAHELKLPIRFVGVGESMDDLVPFDATAYVDALFTSPW